MNIPFASAFHILIVATAALVGEDSQTFAKSPKSSAADRPNIILFITDDQSPFADRSRGKYDSARAFGFNGEHRVHTPEIDRLAREGMIFSRAYVTSSVCSPSRYTALTGRLAGRCTGQVFTRLHPPGAMTRVENNTELEANRLNVAKVLQANGYRTGFVGKCHIVDHPALNQTQKWESEHRLKYYSQEDDPQDAEVSARMKHNHVAWCKRVAQHGFDFVDGLYAANLRELHNKKANVHNVEWTTHAALEFIKTSEQPFFLYYATTTPHGPAPWIKTDGRYVHGLDADPRMTGEGWKESDYSFMPTREAIKQQAVANGSSLEDAWLHWIDSSIGAIRKELEKQGKLDNTLLIITSDHGAWRHGKTTLYEGGLRVPLAMHWPKQIAAGSVYDELVQNTDFTPTILDVAGIEPPEELPLDGVSLQPVLEGLQQPVHDHLFAELGYSRGVLTKDWKYIAVRYDKEKTKRIANGRPFTAFDGKEMKRPYLTRNGHLGFHASRFNPHYFEADQLYHMSEDPEETRNLANNNPTKLEEMQRLLRADLATFPGRPFGELTEPIPNDAGKLRVGRAQTPKKTVLELEQF